MLTVSDLCVQHSFIPPGVTKNRKVLEAERFQNPVAPIVNHRLARYQQTEKLRICRRFTDTLLKSSHLMPANNLPSTRLSTSPGAAKQSFHKRRVVWRKRRDRERERKQGQEMT